MVLKTVLAVVLSIIITFLTGVYVYLTWTYDYWKKRNIKYVKPIPFFGNYYRSATGQEYFAKEVTENAQKYPNEKVVGLFQGGRPALYVRDPELIKDILVKDFWYFCDRFDKFEKYNLYEPNDTNLFAINGEQWKALRQSYSPVFSVSNMKKMFNIIADACKHFENYLDKNTKTNDEINAHDLTSNVTMEMLGSTVFGLQLNTIGDDFNQFRAIGHRIFKLSKSRKFKFFLRNAHPRLFSYFYSRARDQKLARFFLELSKKMVDLRRADGAERHDFIDTNAKLIDKGVLEADVPDMKGGTKTVSFPVTHDLLSSQLLVLYGAGFETSATAMSLTLYEFAKNLSIQEKAQKEIDDVLTRSGGNLTYDDVNGMKYLNMCMKETMRKYPAVGAIFRVCTSKYTFKDIDVTIDPGVLVHIAVLEMHYDPKYFPNPNEYDPERFSPENADKINPITYLPFGAGHRNCIGLRLGIIQTLMGLITILKKFNVETTANTPNILDFSDSQIVGVPGNKICLKLVPRKSGV